MSDSVRPHRWQPIRLPHPWDSPGKSTGVGCHFLLQSMKVKSESEVAQSCLTCSDPMDCSPPGSSVHGIFQARVLEWGAICLPRDIFLERKQHISVFCVFISRVYFPFAKSVDSSGSNHYYTLKSLHPAQIRRVPSVYSALSCLCERDQGHSSWDAPPLRNLFIKL